MSRFVPAGTSPTDAPSKSPSDDAWAAARQDVSSQRAAKQNSTAQEPSKSLYDTLQANKAAKQAEFEDSIRLKNQFKSLDEDDVDFLDSVLESERAKEDAVKKDTVAQLDAYRRQQAAVTKADLDRVVPASQNDTDSWTTKKRKKKELDKPGLKFRKTISQAAKTDHTQPSSSPSDLPQRSPKGGSTDDSMTQKKVVSSPPSAATSTSPPALSDGLDLAGYGSESD